VGIFQFQRPRRERTFCPIPRKARLRTLNAVGDGLTFFPSSFCFTMIAFFPACLPARRITTLPGFILYIKNDWLTVVKSKREEVTAKRPELNDSASKRVAHDQQCLRTAVPPPTSPGFDMLTFSPLLLSY
jgi:hypothetical protein